MYQVSDTCTVNECELTQLIMMKNTVPSRIGFGYIFSVFQLLYISISGCGCGCECGCVYMCVLVCACWGGGGGGGGGQHMEVAPVKDLVKEGQRTPMSDSPNAWHHHGATTATTAYVECAHIAIEINGISFEKWHHGCFGIQRGSEIYHIM